MSSALTLQDWQKAVRLVQDLGRAVAARDPAATDSLLQEIGNASNTLKDAMRTPMAQSTWQGMLADKVPLQFANACCNLIKATCRSNSSSRNHKTATQPPSTPPAPAYQHTACIDPVVEILHVLTLAAHNDLSLRAALQCGQHTPTELQAREFRQHIEQSGLLGVLPQLFDSLAARLQVETGLSTQLKPLQQQQQSATSSFSPAPCTDQLLSLTGAITAALQAYYYLSSAWPVGVFAAEQSSCTHVLKLCWLSFQVASRVLPDSGQASCALVVGMLNLWNAAYTGARTAAFEPVSAPQGSSAAGQQHEAVVLASPCALPCVAVLILDHIYTLLMLQLRRLPPLGSSGDGGSSAGGSAGSSSDNSSSSSITSISSITNAVRAATESACFEGSSATERIVAAWSHASFESESVPASHNLLLQLLGCRSVPLLFAAASRDRRARVTNDVPLHVFLRDLELYLQTYAKLADLPGPGNSAWVDLFREQGPVGSIAHRQLYLLLGPVLLFFSAHQQTHLRGTQQAVSYGVVMQAAALTIRVAATADFRPTASAPALASWLWELVRAEVPALLTLLGPKVLAQLGPRTNTPPPPGSGIPPELTVLHLVNVWNLVQLRTGGSTQGCPSGFAILLGQLLEAGVRGWQQVVADRPITKLMSVLQNFIGSGSQLAEMLQTQLLSVSGGSSSGANAKEAVLLAATQAAAPPVSVDGEMCPEQLQLASLCFSVLKTLASVCDGSPQLRTDWGTVGCCMYVAQAVGSMLRWLAGSGATAAVSYTQQALATTVPWLVLAGRVLLFAAPRLTVLTGSRLRAPIDVQAILQLGNTTVLQGAVSTLVGGLRAWLETPGAADALSAAGYDPSGTLLQQLHAVCELRDPCGSGAQLQSLGQVLNTLPFGCACNNPACFNLRSALEVKLVSGKSLCSGCLVARYCSRACQKEHWKQHGHKPVCRAIAAAAAQAAAGAAESEATVAAAEGEGASS